MNLETITIKNYLTRKGISFRENGKELITRCFLSNCDEDSKTNEAHLYFNKDTGQYECKKCGEKGNIFTLAKHFGDSIQDIALNPRISTNRQADTKFNAELVESCHLALPANIRKYLNARGISDAVINAHKLGWGRFYGKSWITIPIKDIYGAFRFFKLRQDPNSGDDKITYPKGIEAQIYGWDTLASNADKIIICEGELDRLALLSKNISAITSTHGAMTFKEEWVKEVVEKCGQIYICFDNDDAGRKGAERVAKMVENGGSKTFIITLPKEVGESGDITDYFVKLNGNPDDLFNKYAKEYPEKIDTSQFKPLSSHDLVEILGLTIKQDEENKITTFLCELSAFTENAQFNISYNAPSSTGKSYIPTEIARLFPKDDVLELAYCSPTAFFHDVGEWDKDMKGYVVDLSRKILIFLDQPHTQLLERLRPLLSHDKKEINVKITDKTQKFGMKTKNVLLKGYPSVIFCTAGLRIDEQEATRFLLLSPEVNHEKIRQGILESIKKEADTESYKDWLDENPERKLLKERIRAIKLEGIEDIKIAGYQKIIDRFLSDNKILKPRHQRDIKRLVSIIKAFALINLWWREKNNKTITANEQDIEEGLKIWDAISVSQELNLPPYIYNLYQEIILKAWNEKNNSNNEDPTKATGLLGLSRQELLQKHYEVYGRMLDTNQFRQQILPMLETAGLIVQEADLNDKRKILVYPTTPSIKSPKQNNSEMSSGVATNLKIF